MSGSIVTVNVYQQVASAPSALQGTGALISLGGTTLTSGTYSLLTQLSDLTPILATSGSTEILAMATTWFAQGSTTPVYVLELGASATPTALQTFLTAHPSFIYAFLCPKAWDTAQSETVASVTITAAGTGYTSAPTVAFSAPTSGTTATGVATVLNGAVTGVTITNAGSGYTSTPTVTFTGGSGTGVAGTAIMSDAFVAFLENYTGMPAQTYFFITSTGTTYTQYSNLLKCAFVLVEAPAAPTTECSVASAMYKFISYSPSAISRMTQMAFSYLYGVTPYPTPGNAVTLAALKAASINVVGTGAEGGISDAILLWGKTLDGKDASYWYEVDWMVIQSHQALAAMVINGSNNPQAPLNYDQPGINTLLAGEQAIMNSAVAFGVALGPVTVTATSFVTYVTQNPDDYGAGIYKGLAVTATPMNGFQSITFNITVTDIVSG